MDETSFNQRLESLRNRNAKLEEELGKVLAAVDSVILAGEAPTKKALIDAIVATGHRHPGYYQAITEPAFVHVRKGFVGVKGGIFVDRKGGSR